MTLNDTLENSTHYTDSHERKEQTYEAERRWYESGVCYVFDNVEEENKGRYINGLS